MKTPPSNSILINRRRLRQAVPASDMTIWRWEKAGQFPRHIEINGRSYWLWAEVDEWLRQRSMSRA